MPKESNHLIRIGIIVGAGTGSELSGIFKDFLTLLVTKFSKYEIEFVEDLKKDGSPYIYHSYQSLSNIVNGDANESDRISKKEVRRLLKCTKKWSKKGVKYTFRTSINAEALYSFRQKVNAIKVFGVETNSGMRLLFIRDLAEGFYANTSYKVKDNGSKILFNGKFTEDHQRKLIKFANHYASTFLGENILKISITKFHLFSNLIERWYKEEDETIISYQSDTGFTELNRIIVKNNSLEQSNVKVLVICSNEAGDLIFESILSIVNFEAKIELYSRNFYQTSPYNGSFIEYQTVHGSADDLEGTDKVLPYATLRIAADISEEAFGIVGIKKVLEESFGETKRKNLKSTTLIVNDVINYIKLHFNNEKLSS